MDTYGGNGYIKLCIFSFQEYLWFSGIRTAGGKPNGKDLTGEYEKRVQRFVEELEWYASALKYQRERGVPY